ncbi:MAG: helix-turn-helix transcriptional regulator [Bacteroidales bacterium]|jgi:AraC-like DNA-binding protein|nr:helix-turn-helix transcriptional regulator [Bacteroidales bacterium]
MKHKPFISFYRIVCGISFLCLILPPVIRSLWTGAFAGPSWVAGATLSASAVLLLLPIFDEYVRPSVRYAVAILCVCVCCALMDVPLRLWLLAVLIVFGISLLFRCIARYAQLQPLFHNMAVWYGVENQARNSYALALFMLIAMLPGAGAPPWVGWALLPLSLALYALLLVRVFTGRTCFLRPVRELEIKELIRGNLRTAPVQAGEKTEEMARMSRLYARVVTLMEQKRPYLDEGFGLDDLAGAVFTNRGYLSRTINILSGRNFSQFVNYFRVRYGAELLRKDPNLRLISVAQMCGFHSSPSFNAAFKVNMGETPSVYQERLKNEKFEKEMKS